MYAGPPAEPFTSVFSFKSYIDLMGWVYPYSYFSDKEMEVQGGWETCPRFYVFYVEELKFETRIVWLDFAVKSELEPCWVEYSLL